MRIIISHFLIFMIVIVVGCTDTTNRQIDVSQGNKLLGIDSLLKNGIDIPDLVTDEDFVMWEQAVNLAHAVNNDEVELECLIRLFELNEKAENFDDAVETGNRALHIAKELDKKKSLADIYRLFGKTYYHLAIFHKAFENLDIALKLYTELNDTTNIQDVMNMQGNVYFSYNDFDMAYSYYEKNLELGKARNDNNAISKALVNIGVVFTERALKLGVSEDSIEYFNQQAIEYIINSMVFNNKTNQRLATAEIQSNLAEVYRIAGDYDNALINIKDALIISKELSSRVYIWSNITYSNILVDLDSIEAAERILILVEKLAKDDDYDELLITIYSSLSKIYDKQEKYELAYFYYREYSKLSQSIFSVDHKKQIDAIKLARELENEEKQQEIETQNTLYQTMIIFFLLFSVIIIILLFYSRLRQRSRNINLENTLLEERLETRNRELTTRIMALIQRHEAEKEIVKKLVTLKLKLNRENQKEVSDIVRGMSFKQNDQLWKEFEIRFESVHKEFFTKLAYNFPELTTNEKRLCAFLYLDMSSKDISAITGQSIRALNVARTRLRKRFNLTNDTQSISGFLNSL
ncbi:MAG: hypothetical protein HQ521_14320 [Bacteroidetes bacterium]|nr:hypothetical protein [Bacteroidota bacterium]